MSSPYKPGAIVPSSGGLPAGFVALSAAEYADFLTLQAELANIQYYLPPKIYEPAMASEELVLSEDGDVMVLWGGDYAS